MGWAFTRSSETVKQPVLFYVLVWFSHVREPHTFIGRGKSPFHPRSRCFVSAWVLDLCKNTGWLQAKKFHFSRWQFIQLTLIPLTDTWVSTLWHQSFSCLFLTFDETISYWILCSLRSANYKIIVPHTQLAIKWFTQMTKTLKTLFFFTPTIRPRGSLREKSRDQLFEGRLGLNPGLDITRLSFSCVQKHFLGQSSLLFLVLPIINL